MAQNISYYNALLGKLFNNGTALPLRGGLNFVGFTLESSSYGYTITANAVGDAAASDITNDSSVSGATVKDALNTNGSAITANTAAIAAATASIASNTAAIAAATASIADNTSSISTLQGRSITGTGNLSGGGTLAADRTIALNAALTGLTSAVFSTFVTVGATAASGGSFRGTSSMSAYSRNGQGAPNTVDLPVFRNVSDVLIIGGGTEGWLGLQLETTSGAVRLKTGNTERMNTSSAGTVWSNNGGIFTGVVSVNGASVISPTQGTAVTTTVTLQIGNGSEYDVTAAGGAYAITLGTTGAADGDMFILRATNALANAVTVTNGGSGGGNLGPSGVMTSGVQATYYYYYDGTATAWKYANRIRCT